MNIIEIYLKYYNAHLFPLRKRVIGDPKSKQPLEVGFQTKKYTYEELVGYLAKGHGIGWLLGPHDLVLDLDVATAERPNKKGDQVRPHLENLLGSDQLTAMVVSPTGGRHYYLKLPESVAHATLRSKITEFPDVDILKCGKYVVIADSPHWQGDHYRFDDKTIALGHQRAFANDELLRRLSKDHTLGSPAVESAVMTSGDLDEILDALPVTDYRQHDDWFAIMAACHHCTRGDEAGLQSFLRWSLSDPNYASHGDQITRRWNSLHPDKENGYTLGTLLHHLKKVGATETLTRIQRKMDFRESPPEGMPADPTQKSARGSQKVRIHKIPDDYAVNKQIIDALAVQPEIFSRLGQLLSVEVRGSTLDYRPLDAISLTETMHRYCEFGYSKGKSANWTPMPFPSKYGKQIARHGTWDNVRNLRRICSMPIMTHRGIHQDVGYEPSTESFYFTPDADQIPRVPSLPSRQQAESALAELVDLVSEFPFAEPFHRSAWLGSLLGVVARPILGPCAPMTIIDGNRSAVGKGLLVDIIGDICLPPGGYAAKFTGLDKNEDEQRKVFLALARENPIIGVFDNLRSGGKIGSPVLDAILTTGHVSGRLLGLSKIIQAEFDTVLFATANRILIDPNSDLLRRIFYILLRTTSENPEQRNFKYPDIRAHVQQNRGRYLVAALTIVEYARLNLHALPPVSPWGSYNGYELVRRVLVDLGEPDPRDATERLKTTADGSRELPIIVRLLEILGASKSNPMTAREIGYQMDLIENSSDREAREVIEKAKPLLNPKNAIDVAHAIGNSLSRKYRDQSHGGKWIRGVPKKENSTNWWVEAVEPENTGYSDGLY